MTDLKQQIKSDLTLSMKAGTKDRTQTLRMLLAEVMAGEKATQPDTADRSVKRYHTKLLAAKKEMAEYPVKVEALNYEISVVEAYLPKGASKDEVLAFVKTLDLSKPFGDVMKQAKGKFPNDGKLVAETVKELQQEG